VTSGIVAGVGLLTDYFVADRRRAEALVEHGPAETDLPKLLMKWVEPAILGSKLWAIIDDVPVDDSSDDDDGLPYDPDGHDALGDPVAEHDENSCGVVQIADGFVRALAALPADRVAAVAERWATAEEWMGPWEPGELDPTVDGLCELARQVKDPEQHMYMWWSL
jgi:hypothetical protein